MRLIEGKWDEPAMRIPLNVALMRDLLRSDRTEIAGCSERTLNLSKRTPRTVIIANRTMNMRAKKNDGEPSFCIDALFHKQTGLKTQLT